MVISKNCTEFPVKLSFLGKKTTELTLKKFSKVFFLYFDEGQKLQRKVVVNFN